MNESHKMPTDYVVRVCEEDYIPFQTEYQDIQNIFFFQINYFEYFENHKKGVSIVEPHSTLVLLTGCKAKRRLIITINPVW